MSSNQKYQIDQHLATNLHKESEKRCVAKLKQSFISSAASTSQGGDTGNEFFLDLCSAMAQSNIPWHKLEQPSFRAFLEKYCNRHIPNESTLRKNYLNKCYQERISKIREKLCDKAIYIVVDETTDICGRYVANMLVGVLSDTEAPISYFVHSAVLDKTNHSTIARFINDGLTLLYTPNPVKSESLKLMLSDAAAYMIKAGQALQVFYPNLLHFTCMAHAMNRVAELVRLEYHMVNKLINNGKKAFLKAPSRVQRYKDVAPDLPLPPEPIITRWGTWLEAANFYADNFNQIKEVFLGFDDSESAALKLCKECISNENIANQLAFIKTHFSVLISSIKKLETSQMPLLDSFKVVEDAIESLKSVPGDIGEKVVKKLDSVLLRNPGYNKIAKICSVLRGQNVEDLDIEPNAIASMKFAPITSCDVERSFSAYKNILTDKRQNFTATNLNQLLVIYCNPTI